MDFPEKENLTKESREKVSSYDRIIVWTREWIIFQKIIKETSIIRNPQKNKHNR